MTKEEELQNSLSKTIDHYEKYISELNHQSVMVYAAARNYEDKCKLLQDKLALTEKALELACKECLSFPCSDYCSSNDDCEDCYYKREFTPENFKTKAKEMLKDE